MNLDMPVVVRSAQLELLTQINVNDLLSALGLGDVRLGRPILELLCRRPGRRFARQVVTYDQIVGAADLRAGHAWVLEQFVKRVDVRGQAHIPRSGPLLIVSNHPGQSDGSALFASIPRPDLRIVSAPHPLIRALPHTARYLFFIPEAVPGRVGLIRAVARHLRDGGAVLIFPGGQIEPDPALLPGAVDALQSWSTSVDHLARLVPQLTIVPAVASGVLSPKALRHPLVYLRRQKNERRRLAAILQILVPAFHDVTVQLTFGRPVHLAEPDPGAATPSDLVLAEIRRLLEACGP